jgi:branched-chain amino acid transport system substrate-binding protein
MKAAFKKVLALSLCLLGAAGAAAETGVAPGSILLGQSVVLSGPQAENGVNYTNGIKLYLDQINAKGGVHGRKIQVKTLDDGYDPKKTAANTQKLIDEDRVFVLFGYTGTGSTLATLPIAEKAQVPLIAPFTGADMLREKTSRMLFVVRAGYRDELVRMVEQLVTTGVKDIAIAYQDDNFGKSVLKSAEEALEKFKLKAIATGAIDGKTYDARKAVETIVKTKPGAILMGTAGQASVAFIRDYLKTGERPQFFGLSVMSATQLRKELGPDSAGIAVAQVVPSPWSSKHPIVKQYREALGKGNQQDAHHAGLEGYIAAKVLVEGLKRAGKDLTREKLIAALEGMRNLDLGDFVIDYSPEKHTGSTFVDLSIIRSGGQFVQ